MDVLRCRFHRFSAETSLHGYRDLANAPNRLLAAFWAVSIAASVSVMIFEVHEFMNEYMLNPTATQVETEPLPEFPSIVICPDFTAASGPMQEHNLEHQDVAHMFRVLPEFTSFDDNQTDDEMKRLESRISNIRTNFASYSEMLLAFSPDMTGDFNITCDECQNSITVEPKTKSSGVCYVTNPGIIAAAAMGTRVPELEIRHFLDQRYSGTDRSRLYISVEQKVRSVRLKAHGRRVQRRTEMREKTSIRQTVSLSQALFDLLFRTQSQYSVTMLPDKTIEIGDNFTGYATSSFDVPKHYVSELESVLVPRGLLRDRTRRLAQVICDPKNVNYRQDGILALGILNGCYRFFADLLEDMKSFQQWPVDVEFMRIKSYVNSSSDKLIIDMGNVDLNKFKNRRLLIVEDIVTTGKTITSLMSHLQTSPAAPASIEVAALLLKRTPLSNGMSPDYVGFSIPDHFVVGYGMDFNERYRDMDHVCVLGKEAQATYATHSTKVMTNGMGAI